MLSPSTFLPSRLKMPTPTNGILTKGSVSDSHCHANATWQRAPRRPAWHANMQNSQWTSELTRRAAHGSSSKSIIHLFSVSFTAQYSSDIQGWNVMLLFLVVVLFVRRCFFFVQTPMQTQFSVAQFVLRNCLQFVKSIFLFVVFAVFPLNMNEW